MAKRKGRKCPVQKKKERRQRERVDKGTEQQLERFRLLVGREKRNNKDSAAENPVRVLHARGYLTDMQASALLGYTCLYWHYVYQEFIRPRAIVGFRELAGNGSVSMPSQYLEMNAEQKEQEFIKLDDALKKKGAMPRKAVRLISLEELIDENNLHINFPKFFVRQVICERRGEEFKMTRVEKNELAILQIGANALIE